MFDELINLITRSWLTQIQQLSYQIGLKQNMYGDHWTIPPWKASWNKVVLLCRRCARFVEISTEKSTSGRGGPRKSGKKRTMLGNALLWKVGLVVAVCLFRRKTQTPQSRKQIAKRGTPEAHDNFWPSYFGPPGFARGGRGVPPPETKRSTNRINGQWLSRTVVSVRFPGSQVSKKGQK